MTTETLSQESTGIFYTSISVPNYQVRYSTQTNNSELKTNDELTNNLNLNTSINVYKTDVKIEREHTSLTGTKTNISVRKPIREFSDKSKERLKFYARNLRDMQYILHLTYPSKFPTDAKTVQSHWSRMRKYLTKQGVKGLCIREFQKRNAIHFHIFMDKLIDRERISEIWYRIVNSNDITHLHAGTRVERIRSQMCLSHYLTKYNKSQHEVPKEFVGSVGRFWSLFGYGKEMPLVPDHTIFGAKNDIEPIVNEVKALAETRLKYKIFDNGVYNTTIFNAAKVVKQNIKSLCPDASERLDGQAYYQDALQELQEEQFHANDIVREHNHECSGVLW